MSGYLGEVILEQSKTPFADYTANDWAMYFISGDGQTDGSHHKAWVLDQVARILKGTPVVIKLAAWDDGETNWRISTVEPPSQEYLDWVQEMRGEYDADEDDYAYNYDEGIAP